jgi:ubiquinone/menaquinone biosynthesis C-methylase UbiE
MTEIDAQAIKQRNREDWDHAAPAWRKYDESLRRGSEPLTRRLLDLAGIEPGQRVLDIASGTGEPGLPAAVRISSSGSVLLTDQSQEMLAVARNKARAQGLQNVDFLVSDAEQLQLEPESFDAVLCRGALQLMPDPIAVLRVAFHALKPGGRIAVSVMGRIAANPYFTLPFVVLRKYASLPPYDPALPGDQDHLYSALSEAGFRDLYFETLEHVPMEFENGRAYWEYSRGFSVAASLLSQIRPDQHDRIGEEVAALAEGGNHDGRMALKSEAALASGIK